MRYTHSLPKLAALLFFPIAAFAGKSLVLTPSINRLNSSVIDPLLGQNQSWRVEFQIHDWILPPPGDFANKIFQLDGTGASAILYPGGLLALEDTRDSVTPAQPCFVNTSGHTNVLVRFQRDLAGMRVTCELWNYDGTGYGSQVVTINSAVPHTISGGFLGNGARLSLGFLRVFTSVVPLGGRPPTTANGGDWTELKFDNNPNDSSGRGHHATITGATYVDTPNQIAIALPKTAGAPSWNNWVSLRAGYPAQLDGTASFSMADASSTVSYFWQQISGPTLVRWVNRNAPMPTLTGLVFGTYTFALRVTDAAGSTAVSNLQVGAVAYDDNGVVIPSDPRVTEIFGPMIAFGKNPWGWMDERAYRANNLQLATPYESAPPTWATPGQGTVAYHLLGIGPFGQAGTTLTGSITATATTISVADASRLPGLTSLPNWILIGNNLGGGQELVRVIATTATTGPATLTVGYDGRGVSAGQFSAISYPSAAFAPAQPWSSGVTVGEFRVSGTGTKFVTDPNSPLCPLGAPGPMGTPYYSTGTVTLTGGSPVITGNSTGWINALGPLDFSQNHIPGNAPGYYYMRINATHGGGIPFVWWATLISTASNTSTTWTRPLPPDVDPGPFSYSIMLGSFMVLNFSDSAGTYRAIFEGAGCESETSAFGSPIYGFASFPGAHSQTAQNYSWETSTSANQGVAGAFGPNFYGTGLAQRAFYYRSGLTSALTGARAMDDYWVRDPHLCGGFGCAGSPLLVGGGIIGAFASVVLDPNSKLAWSDLRQFAKVGSIGSEGCNTHDTRDGAYLESWVTLAGLYDPDSARRGEWRTNLQAINTRNNACRTQGQTSLGAETNSFSNGFLWAPNGSVLTPATGSRVMTGTNIPAGTCRGIASGTGTITANATSLTASTGTFLNTGNTIIIAGISAGLPFVAQYQTAFVNSTTLNLAAVWPVEASPVSWMQTTLDLVSNSDNLMTIASGNSDPNLTKNWECIWNNSSSITLNRPWDGVNTGPLYSFRYSLAGYGQQPYMLGIKTLVLEWASGLDQVLGTNFGSDSTKAGGWIHDYGYDPVTQGMHYGRVFQVCEPATVPPPGSMFDYRTPNCNRGLEISSVVAARALTQETGPGLRAYYEANPTAAAKNWGDTAYGSLWCLTAYTAPGFYCDSSSPGNNMGQSNMTDAYLGGFKWTGFFFGVGMAHQWPAVRVGGGLPPRIRTVYTSFNLGAAASARIIVTAPSGAATTTSCGAISPCAITVDDRQGRHWFIVQYLSSTGQVIAQSDPDLLAAGL